MTELRNSELYDAKRLAELLKVSKRMVFRFLSSGKISNFFWKLYEKTLKVIVDAVLERCWPK